MLGMSSSLRHLVSILFHLRGSGEVTITSQRGVNYL